MRLNKGLASLLIAGSLVGCSKADFGDARVNNDYRSFEGVPLEVESNTSEPDYSHLGVSIDDSGVKYFDFSFRGGNSAENHLWQATTENAVLKLRTAKSQNSKVKFVAYTPKNEAEANGVYPLRAIGNDDFSTILFPRSNAK